MNESIGRHGLIGEERTAALVSAGGVLDWLCWPDFDSEACFASLIGEKHNGHWMLAPRRYRSAKMRYLPGTLVLETTYKQPFGGSATVTDFMPVGGKNSAVVRIVRGLKGRTRMRCLIAPRLDYGNAQPTVECAEPGCWTLVVGPHRMVMRSSVPLEVKAGDLEAEWVVAPGRHSHSRCSTASPTVSPCRMRRTRKRCCGRPRNTGENGARRTPIPAPTGRRSSARC